VLGGALPAVALSDSHVLRFVTFQVIVPVAVLSIVRVFVFGVVEPARAESRIAAGVTVSTGPVALTVNAGVAGNVVQEPQRPVWSQVRARQ
jgi:hypothetical protein